MSLATLHQRIRQLGGAGGSPVVPLSLFFEGNEDRGSIGCNLSPHPGISTFRRVLDDIRVRPDVADVVVQIVDDMGDDEWPFSDRVYVITTATDEEVHACSLGAVRVNRDGAAISKASNERRTLARARRYVRTLATTSPTTRDTGPPR